MRKELSKNSLMTIFRKIKPSEIKILRNSMYLDSLLIKDSKKKKTKYDAMTSWSSKYDAMPWLSFKNQPSLKKSFLK